MFFAKKYFFNKISINTGEIQVISIDPKDFGNSKKEKILLPPPNSPRLFLQVSHINRFADIMSGS